MRAERAFGQLLQTEGWGLLSDAYKTLLAIHHFWEDRSGRAPRLPIEGDDSRTGVSYSELVEMLNTDLTPHAISCSLDILLDFGLCTPSYAEVYLSGSPARTRAWRRVYRPSGETRRTLQQFIDLIYTTRHGRAPSPGRHVGFTSIALGDHEAFVLSCCTLDYAMAFAQQRSDGLGDLLRTTGVYKLLANLLIDLRLFEIGKPQYAKVMARQYGRIPIFPRGVVSRDLTWLQMAAFGHFAAAERRMSSTLAPSAVRAVSTKLQSIGFSSADRARLEDHVLLYLSLARETVAFKGFPVEALNVAATSHDYRSTIESACFEATTMSAWMDALVQSLIWYAKLGQPGLAPSAVADSAETLQQRLGEWRAIPAYGNTSAARIDPAPDDVADAALAALGVTDIHASVRGVRDEWRAMASLACKQASAARGQLKKKVTDYVERLGRLRDDVIRLRDESANRRDSIRYADLLLERLVLPTAGEKALCRRVSSACEVVDQVLDLGGRVLEASDSRPPAPRKAAHVIRSAYPDLSEAMGALSTCLLEQDAAQAALLYRRVVDRVSADVVGILAAEPA
jgi:hypothetical protein